RGRKNARQRLFPKVARERHQDFDGTLVREGGARGKVRRRSVSAKKHAVDVMIGGEEYTVRSDLPPEYTRDVAAYVDQALKKVLSQGPIVETHKAAILAALDITNALLQTT